MSEWWRPISVLLQRADRIPALARGARVAYLGAAEFAARAFATLAGVDGVYLNGSLTRPEHLHPGLSDIDLVIAVSVPTLESELELRAKLRRIHRAINAVVPVFTNLDYVETGDLNYLRHFGNAWCLDLDHRWHLLSGTNRLQPNPPERPGAERDLMRLTRCVKRWMKASPPLLLASKPNATDRQAERLLVDVIAGYTDRDRLSHLDDLLSQKLPDLPTLKALQSRGEPTVDRCLIASLELLDHWAELRAADWHGAWPVSGSVSVVDAAAPVPMIAASFLSNGFRSVVMLTRGHPLGGRILAAIDADAPAEDTLARTKAALGTAGVPLAEGFEWAKLPVVLTPALWRLAALVAPEPFVGAATSAGVAWSAGGPLAVPPAPPFEDIAALVRATGVRLLLRRLVRSRREERSWQQEQTFELRWMHGAVHRFERTGAFDLGGAIDDAPVGEADAIRRARDWMVEHRRDLDRALV